MIVRVTDECLEVGSELSSVICIQNLHTKSESNPSIAVDLVCDVLERSVCDTVDHPAILASSSSQASVC
jgi:hypothetical protein